MGSISSGTLTILALIGATTITGVWLAFTLHRSRRALVRYVEHLEDQLGELRRDFDEDRADRVGFMYEANARLDAILKHLESRNGRLVEEVVTMGRGDTGGPIIGDAGTPGIGGHRD